MYYKLCVLLLSIGVFSCKTTKVKEQLSTPNMSITFGSGGGFTGIVKSYTLQSNGDLFVDFRQIENEKPLFRIKQSQCDQFFAIYDKMNFINLQIDLPGNLYHFIEYNSADTQHKIVWATQQDIPKELNIFYQMLNQLIKIK